MLRIRCPQCTHTNRFSLDDLMGKYAVCGGCGKLIKITEENGTERGRQSPETPGKHDGQ